jgi:hypothetical protein
MGWWASILHRETCHPGGDAAVWGGSSSPDPWRVPQTLGIAFRTALPPFTSTLNSTVFAL